MNYKEVRKFLRLYKKCMRDLIHNEIVIGIRRDSGEKIHVTRMLYVLDHILHQLYSPVIVNLLCLPIVGVDEDQTIRLELIDGSVSSLTPLWSTN